jgi:hypothetical protein
LVFCFAFFLSFSLVLGGKQLQAHLSVLYENHYYLEYLNILQTMLITFWREKSFGKEEFSVGNFGKSDSASEGERRIGSRSGVERNRKSSSSVSSSFKSRGGSPHGQNDDSSPSWKVNTVNTAFSQHYKEDSGDVGHLQREKKKGNAPKVSFYDNLLNDQIVPSIRSEINEKVDMYLSQQENQQMHHLYNSSVPASPSSYLPSSFQQGGRRDVREGELQSASDIAFSLLTIKELGVYWKQLILTTLAVGIMCLERKEFDKGMKFFLLADEWSRNEDLLPLRFERKQYRAYVKDSMSYYFFKKEKFIASSSYSKQAMKSFEEIEELLGEGRKEELEGMAICLLHISATYCQMSKFKEAHKVILF